MKLYIKYSTFYPCGSVGSVVETKSEPYCCSNALFVALALPEVPDTLRAKMALFCNVRKESIIANRTAGCLYEVPLMLEKEGLAVQTCKHRSRSRYRPRSPRSDDIRSRYDEPC